MCSHVIYALYNLCLILVTHMMVLPSYPYGVTEAEKARVTDSQHHSQGRVSPGVQQVHDVP